MTRFLKDQSETVGTYYFLSFAALATANVYARCVRGYAQQLFLIKQPK